MGLSIAYMLVIRFLRLNVVNVKSSALLLVSPFPQKVQAMNRRIRWGDDDDTGSGGNDSTNQFKDGHVDFQLKTNPSSNNKRPSVRRLLSTSSAATTIAEDSEINI